MQCRALEQVHVCNVERQNIADVAGMLCEEVEHIGYIGYVMWSINTMADVAGMLCEEEEHIGYSGYVMWRFDHD